MKPLLDLQKELSILPSENELLIENKTTVNNAMCIAKIEVVNRPTPMSYSLLSWAYYQNNEKLKALEIAKKYNLYVVEDAAQAIESFYKNKPLGSIGNLAAFSFHETKNIISGEGGMLTINDPQFEQRAEIIWEKGAGEESEKYVLTKLL